MTKHIFHGTLLVGTDVHGVQFTVVTLPDLESQPNLFEVVQTTGALGGALGLGQRGQQQGGKNGDDSDDHQQFDQRKGFPGFHIVSETFKRSGHGVYILKGF
jgi:hypothetical protein